jgi:hypothetical protein
MDPHVLRLGATLPSVGIMAASTLLVLTTASFRASADPRALDLGAGVNFGFTVHRDGDTQTGFITTRKFDLYDLESTASSGKSAKGLNVMAGYQNMLMLDLLWIHSGFDIDRQYLPDSVSSWTITSDSFGIVFGIGFDVNQRAKRTAFGKPYNLSPFLSFAVGKTWYADTVHFTNGATDHGSYLLQNVGYYGFGFGVDWKLGDVVSIKPSLNVEVRDFGFKDASQQPDGSADSVRLSVEMSLFNRWHIPD